MNNSEILKQIIESRKSTYPKDYTGEEISQEILDEILSSAQFAPNHKKTKPWRFRVFRGEEKQQLAKEIQEIYKATTPEHLFLEKKYLDFADKIAKTEMNESDMTQEAKRTFDFIVHSLLSDHQRRRRGARVAP